MPIIETFKIPNFSSNNIVAEAQLSSDNVPPSTAISLLNAADIDQNDYIVVNPERATGELAKVSSITGEALTLTGNLVLQHRKNERVVKLFGNKVRVYKAADVNGLAPAVSAFSTLVGDAVIDPTTGDSFFTDSNGGSGFWYIFTYYNETSAAETDKTLAEPIRGGGYGNYCSLEEIKDEAGISDVDRMPDWKIATRRDQAQSEINGKLASAGYTIPLQTTTNVSFIPGIIKEIDILLSAGLLLKKNFGIARPGSGKNGQDKIDEARKMLAEIQLNDTVLLDSTGTMLLKDSLVDGWPDQTTQSTKPGDLAPTTGPVMTMDKVF